MLQISILYPNLIQVRHLHAMYLLLRIESDLPIPWPGDVGVALCFHSILQFNSGEFLNPMNLLLRIASDLRFPFL
jgi:hypothetical protein